MALNPIKYLGEEGIEQIGKNISDKIDKTEKGSANGIAELDATGKVPVAQLPSYADNVVDNLTSTDTTKSLSANQGKVLKGLVDEKALKSKYGDTEINVGRKANTPIGNYSTAEGYNTTASGYASHAEGSNAYTNSNGEITFYDTRTVTISDDVTVEVDSSQAYGVNSHAEGCQTLAYGNFSHAEGRQTTASGSGSHAEGVGTTANGTANHAEGVGTIANGARCHVEGIWTIASGSANHAEGKNTTANGNNSCHAEGYNTTASGIATHAEGSSDNRIIDVIADFSWNDTTNEDIINAWNTQKFSVAHGRVSHVEGSNNLSLGHASHAEGQNTIAVGNRSHTSGFYTKALHENEAAYGKYNESNEDTLFSIGDGTADDARHNAFEITTDGGKLHDKDIATMDELPNPNLLINPDFKINQRGKSGNIVPDKNANGDDIHTYFVDRWGIDSGSVTINTDGTLTLNGTMSQILENSVGTNVTASVSAGTATYDNITQTFTITGNGDVISWAKLEIGSAATAFIPPDPATEFLKCCRYFQIIDNGSPLFGIVTNSSRIRLTMPIICPMRKNPTVSLLQHTGDFTWSFTIKNAAGTSSFITMDFSAMSAAFIRTDGAIMNVYINISHTLSTGEIVYTGGTGGIYFSLDAEIY